MVRYTLSSTSAISTWNPEITVSILNARADLGDRSMMMVRNGLRKAGCLRRLHASLTDDEPTHGNKQEDSVCLSVGSQWSEVGAGA